MRTVMLFSITLLLLTTGLRQACAAAGTPRQSDSAPVTLNIADWCCIHIDRPLTMQVDPEDFTNYDVRVSDACKVDLDANYCCVLVCPKTVILTRTDPPLNNYSIASTVNLLSTPAVTKYDANYAYLHMPCGAYDGDISLQVAIDKQWMGTDMSGTYTGSVTLSVYAEPYGP